MQNSKVLSFILQGDKCIWQQREESESSLSMGNINKDMKNCKFQSYRWRYNNGSMAWIFRFTMFGFREKFEPRHQGISVDDNNGHAPKYTQDEVPQLVNDYSCRSEGIICLRWSNNLHNTYAAFKKYFLGR